MIIKSAGEILTSEIRDAINILKGCVTPIFSVNEKGEAQLLGSAVLLDINGEIFLGTAKHVIDENKKSTLYFDGPHQLEVLEGDFYSSHDHDVAALKLMPEQVSAFKKYSPLTTNKIANLRQAASCKYVEFTGYPESKNRKIYQRNMLKNEIYSFGCTVISIDETRVRLNFNKKRNIDAKSRQRVTSPDLYGLSGGAMFGVTVDTDTIEGKPFPRLIGISTDWPNSSEVFGSNIAVVIALIRDAWQIELPSGLDPKNMRTNHSPSA